MFRETALLNHEKFCESIRRKRLPIATPESVKRPHKTKKISVAEQITRSVEKLCINSQVVQQIIIRWQRKNLTYLKMIFLIQLA